MITSINFFISDTFSDDYLRKVMGKLCDVIDECGLASTGELDDGVKTVAVARIYDVHEVEEEKFLDEVLGDSLIVVIPISTKEKNDSSN